MLEILSSAQFWGLVLPLVGATLAWLANEHSKRKWLQHERREEKYIALIEAADGFYVSAKDPATSRSRFLEQVRLAWLYCPDDVIKLAYEFLESVKVGERHSAEEKERRFGELMAAIRTDQLNPKLVRRTQLKAEDYKHLMVTK